MNFKTFDDLYMEKALSESRSKGLLFIDEASLIRIPKRYVETIDLIKGLEKTTQFACLESWCASRENDGKDFCRNCKSLLRLKQEGHF